MCLGLMLKNRVISKKHIFKWFAQIIAIYKVLCFYRLAQKDVKISTSDASRLTADAISRPPCTGQQAHR